MTKDPLEILMDKQAITEAIYRYCRSLDRGDYAGLHDVFHPDAALPMHSDPSVCHKDAADFIKWMGMIHDRRDRCLSRVSNMLIQVDGNQAGSETYLHSEQRTKLPDGKVELNAILGRYLDRWEKRDGHWAISSRRYVREFLETRIVEDNVPPESTDSARGRDDPSYEVIDLDRP